MGYPPGLRLGVLTPLRWRISCRGEETGVVWGAGGGELGAEESGSSKETRLPFFLRSGRSADSSPA